MKTNQILENYVPQSTCHQQCDNTNGHHVHKTKVSTCFLYNIHIHTQNTHIYRIKSIKKKKRKE